MSHQEYLATTDYSEVREYEALNLLDPPVGDRIDAGFAKLAWIIHSMMKSADSDSTTIADWTPDYSGWLLRNDPTKEDEWSDEYDRWYESVGKALMEKGKQ
jgi:hypothetical protein